MGPPQSCRLLLPTPTSSPGGLAPCQALGIGPTANVDATACPLSPPPTNNSPQPANRAPTTNSLTSHQSLPVPVPLLLLPRYQTAVPPGRIITFAHCRLPLREPALSSCPECNRGGRLTGIGLGLTTANPPPSYRHFLPCRAVSYSHLTHPRCPATPTPSSPPRILVASTCAAPCHPHTPPSPARDQASLVPRNGHIVVPTDPSPNQASTSSRFQGSCGPAVLRQTTERLNWGGFVSRQPGHPPPWTSLFCPSQDNVSSGSYRISTVAQPHVIYLLANPTACSSNNPIVSALQPPSPSRAAR